MSAKRKWCDVAPPNQPNQQPLSPQEAQPRADDPSISPQGLEALTPPQLPPGAPSPSNTFAAGSKWSARQLDDAEQYINILYRVL